jgi:hypothetical protein
MKNSKKRVSPLAEVELETLEEGREWTRRRLERKLQKMADRQGAISPPEPMAAQGSQDPCDDDPDHGGGRGD